MNGYPDEKILKQIETWNGKDPQEMLEWIDQAWNHEYGDMNIESITTGVDRVEFVTGGWSGNEDVMSAIYKNRLFDGLFWMKSERGGSHVYEVYEVKN
jgi:hypothetical protein